MSKQSRKGGNPYLIGKAHPSLLQRGSHRHLETPSFMYVRDRPEHQPEPSPQTSITASQNIHPGPHHPVGPDHPHRWDLLWWRLGLWEQEVMGLPLGFPLCGAQPALHLSLCSSLIRSPNRDQFISIPIPRAKLKLKLTAPPHCLSPSSGSRRFP